MLDQRIIDFLPELYRNFFPDFFETRTPLETAATCDDCAMWRDSEGCTTSDLFFSEETKCCTYYPNLPNYLVGAILSASDPSLQEGQERVRKIIASRVKVTPHGLQRPLKYKFLSDNAPSSFGRSRHFLCPFYNQNEGKCSIWPYRYSKCCTWFCKYSAGADGRSFWRSLDDYLKFVEITLLQFALYKMGWIPEKIIFQRSLDNDTTVQDIDEPPLSQEEYSRLWMDWENKEEDFYIQTYHLVSELSPQSFNKITGITQKILLSNLQTRCRSMLHPKLPSPLKRNPSLKMNRTEKGSYFLVGYSGTDPVEVSKRVYDLLDFFDGRRSTQEAVQLIRACMNAEPSDRLLSRLCQFRILIEH